MDGFWMAAGILSAWATALVIILGGVYWVTRQEEEKPGHR